MEGDAPDLLKHLVALVFTNKLGYYVEKDVVDPPNWKGDKEAQDQQGQP